MIQLFSQTESTHIYTSLHVKQNLTLISPCCCLACWFFGHARKETLAFIQEREKTAESEILIGIGYSICHQYVCLAWFNRKPIKKEEETCSTAAAAKNKNVSNETRRNYLISISYVCSYGNVCSSMFWIEQQPWLNMR